MFLGLQSAWCVVFVCRLWWCYLENLPILNTFGSKRTTNDSRKNINSYFITKPAYLSVELNAHNLLYFVLLIKQKHLPKQALRYIPSFNSQACESIFRDTRSLTGTFSTRTNFTVKDFLKRSCQLSILNQLKYNQFDRKISFPVHHKQKNQHLSTTSCSLDDIDSMDVEQIISSAYNQAVTIVEHSKIHDNLKKMNINSLCDLSEYVYNTLQSKSKLINHAWPTLDDTIDEFGLDDENDDKYGLDLTQDHFSEKNYLFIEIILPATMKTSWSQKNRTSME